MGNIGGWCTGGWSYIVLVGWCCGRFTGGMTVSSHGPPGTLFEALSETKSGEKSWYNLNYY